MAERLTTWHCAATRFLLRGFCRLFIPDVKGIGVDEAWRRTVAGDVHGNDGRNSRPILLVDVRTDRERGVSMIPGSVSRSGYEMQRDDYAGRQIVPYCTIGYRSAHYTRQLKQQGIDAANLVGSIVSWAEAGLPLVTPDGDQTQRLHTWSRCIPAPAGYQQVVE